MWFLSFKGPCKKFPYSFHDFLYLSFTSTKHSREFCEKKEKRKKKKRKKEKKKAKRKNAEIRKKIHLLEKMEEEESSVKKNSEKPKGQKKKGSLTGCLKCEWDGAEAVGGGGDLIAYEIGVDEVGRGPLFGRLYVAAVILPRKSSSSSSSSSSDLSFDFTKMKDSKKFSSAKKLSATADHIREHAVAWRIEFVEASEIDRINIRQAVLKAMRASIAALVREKMDAEPHLRVQNFFALVDGNDFPPFDVADNAPLRYATVEQGDNAYACIAAASILAKVARDDYVRELCARCPILSTRYALDTNMGYGTKKHLEGIAAHGLTNLHRRSYGSCKNPDLRVTVVDAL